MMLITWQKHILSFHDFIMKITKFDSPVVVHTHVSLGTENKEQKIFIPAAEWFDNINMKLNYILIWNQREIYNVFYLKERSAVPHGRGKWRHASDDRERHLHVQK